MHFPQPISWVAYFAVTVIWSDKLALPLCALAVRFASRIQLETNVPPFDDMYICEVCIRTYHWVYLNNTGWVNWKWTFTCHLGTHMGIGSVKILVAHLPWAYPGIRSMVGWPLSPLDYNPIYSHYWSADSRDALVGAHPNSLSSQFIAFSVCLPWWPYHESKP
jgi:hypothetical protein